MTGRLLFIFLLFAGSAAGQFDAGAMIRSVRVRISFANGGCEPGTHVLLSGRVALVADVTDYECEAQFFDVPAGTYHLRVSGQAIVDTDAGAIELTPTGGADFDATVRRSGDPERNYGVPGNAFVSAADLRVPARARKELDKANELIAKQDFAKAEDRLHKAITFYPAYASAYNSLGVVYARRGDREHEREALQKAITINDHFAPAYINLARMNIATGDFPSAEAALKQALSLDSTDPMTLVLLSYSELMDRHFDEAITTSQRAHALGKPHTLVHRIAANAFEQKKQAAGAMHELDLFLAEEPTGPQADAARKDLVFLRALTQPSAAARPNTASVAGPGQSTGAVPSHDR